VKRFFLFGLAALGLSDMAPAQSSADEGFRVYIGPAYQQERPYYYREDYPRYRYYRHQMSIGGSGGTDTIIAATTIGITIGTTIGIDEPLG
jgi:hypothetical protein